MTHTTLNNNLPCGVAAALGITTGFGTGIGLCLWLTAASMVGALLGACIGFIAYGFFCWRSVDSTKGKAHLLPDISSLLLFTFAASVPFPYLEDVFMTHQTLNNTLSRGVAAGAGIAIGLGIGASLYLWLTALIGPVVAGMAAAFGGAMACLIAHGLLLEVTWYQARCLGNELVNISVALVTAVCALALAVYLSELVSGFLAGFLFSMVANALGVLVGIAAAIALCAAVFTVCDRV